MKHYDVIIVGGSYSGLAAAMAMGRALLKVLVVDNGEPCNRQTPNSHNFLTQDGKTPAEITSLSKDQVAKYPTVSFINGEVISGVKTETAFSIGTKDGNNFTSDKVIFATGIKDILPGIKGLSECWGISVLHCPYCHGYEVRNQTTAIIGNGESAYELAQLISNWTNDLILYTNGASSLTSDQSSLLSKLNIRIVDLEISELKHNNGYVSSILFKNGTQAAIKAIYIRPPFSQSCTIPQSLGCMLDSNVYLVVGSNQETSVQGVFACGDNSSRIRTVANAVGTGTTAGMMASKFLILERHHLNTKK